MRATPTDLPANARKEHGILSGHVFALRFTRERGKNLHCRTPGTSTWDLPANARKELGRVLLEPSGDRFTRERARKELAGHHAAHVFGRFTRERAERTACPIRAVSTLPIYPRTRGKNYCVGPDDLEILDLPANARKESDRLVDGM